MRFFKWIPHFTELDSFFQTEEIICLKDKTNFNYTIHLIVQASFFKTAHWDNTFHQKSAVCLSKLSLLTPWHDFTKNPSTAGNNWVCHL